MFFLFNFFIRSAITNFESSQRRRAGEMLLQWPSSRDLLPSYQSVYRELLCKYLCFAFSLRVLRCLFRRYGFTVACFIPFQSDMTREIDRLKTVASNLVSSPTEHCGSINSAGVDWKGPGNINQSCSLS